MSKLMISAKCSDLLFAEYEDDAGSSFQHDGYVPHGIGIGGGDYVDITIDIKTGKIEGWKPLSKSKIFKSFKEA